MNRTRPVGSFALLGVVKNSGGPVSCDTLFTIATALLSSSFRLFVSCSSTFQCGNEHSAPNLHPDLVSSKRHSGGCRFSQSDLVQVPFKSICTVVEELCQSDFCLWRFFFSNYFYLMSLRWSGFWCRFWCTIVTLMPEIALLSFRTLVFFFPLVTCTFSSSNATCSLFDS